MRPILVWDWPTRLFHGLLTVGFLTAFGIAQLGGDDGPAFPFHALIGLVLGLLWGLRILWGFVGTKYARFGSLLYRPGDVLRYTKEALIGKPGRYVGHNPGSGTAALAMFALLPGIVATGLLVNVSEWAEEVHPLLVYAMAAVALVHILGLAVHTVRQRDNIALSMVTGLKEGDPGEEIRSAQPLAGAVLLLLTGLWAGGLARNYDPYTDQTVLPVLGSTVYLSESEHGTVDHAGDSHENEEGDHD